MNRRILEIKIEDSPRYVRDCEACLRPINSNFIKFGVDAPFVLECPHCLTVHRLGSERGDHDA